MQLAEVFRQSEKQLASLLTKYEDVMQSQNDDREEQTASLRVFVSLNLYKQLTSRIKGFAGFTSVSL